MIYLDNSATTQPCEACVRAMTELLTDCWGNPSSVHAHGIAAHHRLRQAREQVASALGAEPESICAAMGASIGRCCFETDDDVPDAVKKYLGCDAEEFFDRRPGGKTMVDLRAANAMRLRQLGLRAENIDVSHECTMCSHEKYWSHRYTQRMGQGRGSLAAGIVLD